MDFTTKISIKATPLFHTRYNLFPPCNFFHTSPDACLVFVT